MNKTFVGMNGNPVQTAGIFLAKGFQKTVSLTTQKVVRQLRNHERTTSHQQLEYGDLLCHQQRT